MKGTKADDGHGAIDAAALWRRIGAQLRQRRRALNLTLEEVANELRCSPEQVSRLESGTSGTTLVRLLAAARFLGVDLAALLEEPSGTDGEDSTTVAITIRERYLTGEDVQRILDYSHVVSKARQFDLMHS